MWLAGLHVPESYLTAIVQIACRTNEWPLDKSTLYTTVTQYKTETDIKTDRLKTVKFDDNRLVSFFAIVRSRSGVSPFDFPPDTVVHLPHRLNWVPPRSCRENFSTEARKNLQINPSLHLNINETRS